MYQAPLAQEAVQAQPTGGFFKQLHKLVGPVESSPRHPLVIPVGSDGSDQDLSDLAELDRSSASKPGGINGQSPSVAFHEKLTLEFLERLWVKMKNDAMDQAQNRDCDGEVNAEDFKKLAKDAMLEFGEANAFTPEDEEFLDQLFDRVARRKSSHVRTTDVATAIIIISKADPISKLKSLFSVFDADDDSCLTPDEIFNMYFAIKCNDITKDQTAMVADLIFEDEPSLQEAKRLYECTVQGMGKRDRDSASVWGDFIMFEEFAKVFENRQRIKVNVKSQSDLEKLCDAMGPHLKLFHPIDTTMVVDGQVLKHGSELVDDGPYDKSKPRETSWTLETLRAQVVSKDRPLRLTFRPGPRYGNELLDKLLPGSFSLEWILQEYRPTQVDPSDYELKKELVHSYISSLRRSDKHLNLREKKGRGVRIMQACLDGYIPSQSAANTDEGTERETTRSRAVKLPELTMGSKPAPSSQSARGAAKTPRGAKGGAMSARGRPNPIDKASASPSAADVPSSPTRPPGTKDGRPQSGRRRPRPSEAPPRAEADDDAPPVVRHHNNEEDGSDDEDFEWEAFEDLTPAERAAFMEGDVYATDLVTRNAVSRRKKHKETIPAVAASKSSGGKAGTPHGRTQQAPGRAGGRGGINRHAGTRYDPFEEEMKIEKIAREKMVHKHSTKFRQLGAAVGRAAEKGDVNRTFKYNCMLCAVEHSFQVSRQPKHTLDKTH